MKQADTEYPRVYRSRLLRFRIGIGVVRMTDVTFDLYAERFELMRPGGKGLSLFGTRSCGDLDLRIEVKSPEWFTADMRTL